MKLLDDIRYNEKKDFIPVAEAGINEEDIEHVLNVLKTGRLSLGPYVEKFEKEFSRYLCNYSRNNRDNKNKKGLFPDRASREHYYCVALNSGTSALHLSLKALNIKDGDEVLVPSFTFAASVNAILYERAVPVFVDIEERTFNIDPAKIEKKLSSKTRAILVVDVFGHPVEWDRINEIAEKHGLKIIDDASEALGAEYRGRKTGTFGDIAVFSFFPNKQITTGEGGMIVTANEELAEKARIFANQGRKKGDRTHYYQGYSYRMDEMSAALGYSQLSRLDEILEKRERLAALYTACLSGVESISLPVTGSGVRRSWFTCVVLLDRELDRRKIMEIMRKKGIETRAYFSPVHEEPFMKEFLLKRGSAEYRRQTGGLEITDDISKRTLALPFFLHMKEEQIIRVVETLKYAIRHSRKYKR